MGYSANGLARCYLELGEPAQALPLYERILALKTPDPNIRGDVYFGLARALEARGQKRSQALEFARKALDAYGQVKEPQRVSEVNAWLAKHAGSKASPR